MRYLSDFSSDFELDLKRSSFCRFLMGVFTYVYYSSLVKEHHVTVGSVLQLIVSGLTLDEQLELMADFRRYLEGRGIVA